MSEWSLASFPAVVPPPRGILFERDADAPGGPLDPSRRSLERLGQPFVRGHHQRGLKAIIPIPTSATEAPIRSQRSGGIRSTSQPQTTAIATYTPP